MFGRSVYTHRFSKNFVNGINNLFITVVEDLQRPRGTQDNDPGPQRIMKIENEYLMNGRRRVQRNAATYKIFAGLVFV